MGKHTIERYSKYEDGRLMIDISVSKYNELFNEWDNSASYVKKDIDAQLVDYFYECFEEVKNHEFIIMIKVPKKNILKQEKVKESIKKYFEYVRIKEQNKLKAHLKKSVIFFCIGLLFIFLSIYLSKKFWQPKLFQEVIIQGMVIVGWVTLWQALTGVLMEESQMVADIGIYKRIANTEVIFV